METVPGLQISKDVLKDLNPKGKYLVQIQKAGPGKPDVCTPHIYNSSLAKRKDMFILDMATGRPETVKVQGGEVTESIILKDKTFHVDPSLKVVLDEIAEDYEINQSRIRVLEETNDALLNGESELNDRITELESKERLLQDIIVSLKDEIASMGPKKTEPVTQDTPQPETVTPANDQNDQPKPKKTRRKRSSK